MNQPELTVYTDGSCSPNPGNGGWGYIAILPDCEIWANDKKVNTTNNVMELTAVIEALKEFSFFQKIHIYSDSKYVINCAEGRFKRNKNLDLWAQYDKYSKGKTIKFTWVKGHNGDRYNELVDKLAKE